MSTGEVTATLIFEGVGAEDEDQTYNWFLRKQYGAIECDFSYIGDEDLCSGAAPWICIPVPSGDPDMPDRYTSQEYFCWHHAAGILSDLEGVFNDRNNNSPARSDRQGD